MTITCVILGIACILYYVILAVYAGPAFNFGWFWIALGAAFLLIAYLGRFPNSAALTWTRRILLIIVAAGIVLLVVLGSFVIKGMTTQEPESLDYVIVLGTQVKGSTPSRALRRRMVKAIDAAQTYPQAALILSGGKGKGENISEAECMREYLTENGVDEGRIILEDQSTTTQENLIFSDRLTGCSKKSCGIISNDFHICRALLLARKLGYQDAYGLPGQGDSLMELHYIVRESVGIFVGKLSGAL